MSDKVWVNQNAVAWALDDAPCPRDLVATLVALARRANTADGRGAHPTAHTIASNVGKSVITVRKELSQLRALGLIMLGDQSLVVDRYPPGQRPVVYDMAMSVKGPKPIGTSKNKSGKKSVLAGDTHSLEAMGRIPTQTGPAAIETHALEATGTHSLEAMSTHGLEAMQKKTLKKTLEKDSTSLSSFDLDSLEEPPEDYDEREDLSSQDSQPEEPGPYSVQRSYLRKCGIEDEAQLAALPTIIEDMNDVKSPRGWWSHAYANGTLPACIADAKPFVSVADLFGAGSSRSSSGDVYDVPWCTSCDGRNTRRVYVGTGHDLRSNPCPTCSPFRSKPAYDGRRVSMERELDAWNAKPPRHKPYRNDPKRDYNGDLGAPTGPEKDYSGEL